METEELIKLVDGIYKNILDKFNPGARQMINAGKAYLKALHGAAAASRLYVDAIGKLAKQAQQGTWGGSSDIGMALMKIVEVYKEIQDQQMNILKAFYVDLLVPLETNLEKDTKVVQSEQKRFLQQHKQRSETYSKAAAMMKKQRKKSRSSSKTGLAMDKELKNMQVLEEEKTKLDAFCEQSLKNAMTQERRRYGFVLERHCSLAKHYLSYHNQGVQVYQQNIEKWSEVAKTREYLPESVENIFSNRIRQISVWQDEDLYSNPRSPHFDDDDRISINSQLRKTKSMDASCLDIRSIEEASSPINTLSRAKSEYNLNSSTHSLVQSETPTRRPKSMAVPPPPAWDTQLARALYAYLSSGDNQLSFLEGDLISLIGDRNKGWQFGENLRTQCSGWFPLAYTEIIDDSSFSPSHSSVQHPHHHHHQHQHQQAQSNNATPTNSGGPSLPGVAATNANHRNSGGNNNASSLESNAVPPRMFGDTLHLHRSSASAKQFRRAIGSNNIPPPALPAPVPTPSLPYHKQTMTQSQSANFGLPSKLMHVPPSSSSMTTTSTPTGDASSTFQSPYSQPTIKSSQSTFNFSTSGAAGTSTSAYSTHPQPAARGVPGGAQSDRPQTGAVVPLPLHLQTTKSTKIGGGPVGNVSLHSSNDSGFSNDPPPQPEIDYSDDESIQGQTKLPARRNTMHRISDNNNNKLRKSAGLSPMSSASSTIRPSNSSGNLIERRSYYDTESLQEKKVKRTKSFWRFGKAANDHEILEGMSMWKHRDLVDLMMMDDAQKAKNVKSKSTHDQNNNATQKKKKSTTQNSSNKKKKSSSDKMRRDGSNDSDRTMINAKPGDDQVTREMNGKTLRAYAEKMSESQRTSFIEKTRQQQHQHQQQQQREEPRDRRASEMKRQAAKNGNRFDDDDDEEDDEEEEDEAIDEFYDDGDDGLMLRTVNRKNILQQYTNDSTGSDSGSESEMTSDDPYDCILVDDQKVSKRQYPDVHAIGKKLEKLSKSTKYTDTIEKKKNAENLKHNSNGGVNSNNNNNNNGTSSTFKTFGIGLTDEDNRKEQQHTQNHHHKQQEQKDSDGYYKEKGGYANGTLTNKRTQQAQDKEKLKYYAERRRDSIADDYSDATESRQFLPRTKLHKTNSGNNSNKYENESSLMEYGETLPRRLKSPDHGTTFDEKSPHTGNMYGPWYDLWGLDASVRK